MKKTLALLLCAALAAALLAACGSEANTGSVPAAGTPAASTPAAPDAASTPADGAAADTADTARLDAIVAAIEAVNTIPNPRAYADFDVANDPSLTLTADNIVAFKGDVTNNGDDCALVFAAQVKDGTADAVMAELQAAKERMSSNLYAEFADKVAKAQDARILNDGNIVLFVVAGINGPDYADIDAAIESALAQ